MKYEPKVGDEVVVRGKIESIKGDIRVAIAPTGTLVWVRPEDLIPPHDAGEAELRAAPGGPWDLSDAMDKIEARLEALEGGEAAFIVTFNEHSERLAALEASAKVRDVPATMVNLAHRVQGIEGTIKTMMDEGRERDMRWGEASANLQHRRRTVEAVLAQDPRHQPRPEPEDADPHADWSSGSFKDLAPKGRSSRPAHLEGTRGSLDYVTTSIPYLQNLISKNADMQAANNALAERARAAEKMTETIRAANSTMLADLQRAEARVERLASGLRSTRGERSRSEFHRGWAACTDMALATLQADPYKGPLAVAEPKDPAHGANAQASE